MVAERYLTPKIHVMFPPSSPARDRRGFSLVEMIVVVAIIGVIAVFAVPAASTIIRGSQLTQASQVLSDQISLARQYALTKNRAVEVRFIRYGDPEAPGEDPEKPETGKFRAIQLFEVLTSGTSVPVGKFQRLPVTIMLNSDTLSTLIDTESESGGQAPRRPSEQDPELPGRVKKDYDYVSFRFLPDGSTNLLPTKQWYTTVHAITDQIKGNTPPPNFFTLQIDPVSGTSKSYRPSAG
jgi:uncharacterized protein (TIGR02596 family)